MQIGPSALSSDNTLLVGQCEIERQEGGCLGEIGRVVVVGVGRKDGGDGLGEVSRRGKIPGFLI